MSMSVASRLRLLIGIMTLGLAQGCSSDTSHTSSGAQNGSVAPNSWTMLGFDLGSTYNNVHETKLGVDSVKTLKQAWVFKALGSITGVPCVIGKVVYTVSQGRTYKLDVETGKVLWESKEATSTASPACSNGVVYVDDARAHLVALRMSDGTLLWRVTVDPHPKASGFSSPIVVDGKVIVGTSSTEETSVTSGATFRGSVVAYAADSGKELWRFYTAPPGVSGATVWSTVSVDLEAQMVFVATGNNYTGMASDLSDSILALDLADGKLLWSRQLTKGDVFTTQNPMGHPDDDFGANPVLFEAEVGGVMKKLVGGAQKSGWFWAMDRMTGKDVWSHQVSGGGAGTGGMLNNGAFDGKHILAAGNNSLGSGVATLMAMDAGTGKVAWQRELSGLVWAPITIGNGVGFVAVDKQLQAFDVETGKELFSFDTPGTIGGGAAIVDGRVLFGSGFTYTPQVTRNSELYALEVP